MIIEMTPEANKILLLLKAGNDTAHIAKEINATETHVDFVAEQLKMYAFI
ncbi:hypothetical protein VPHD81_0132 [Vibrio phage D81]